MKYYRREQTKLLNFLQCTAKKTTLYQQIIFLPGQLITATNYIKKLVAQLLFQHSTTNFLSELSSTIGKAMTYLI